MVKKSFIYRGKLKKYVEMRELVGRFYEVLLDVFEWHLADELEVLGNLERLLDVEVRGEKKYVAQEG